MTRAIRIGLTGIAALCVAAGCSKQTRTVTLLGDSRQAGWTELFNGRDFGGWRAMDPANNKWMTAAQVSLDPEDDAKFKIVPGSGILVNGQKGNTSNFYTILEHGDCELHIEFMVPKGSNSGIYFQGRYEIQVFDSFGKEQVEFSDCGGIYARWIDNANVEGHAPRTNASKAPGQWQSFDVKFTAPRFDANGNKTANARFNWVRLNGTLIHENVELTGPTRSAMGENKEVSAGPLMLQGDHGPVAYRNIRIRLLK